MAGMITYGRTLRDLWPLAPDVTYLNHGGYGVVPNEIMAHAAEWRARIETNPMRFMTRDYHAALRAAAGSLADCIGAQPEQVVFLGNATDGINAILRSLKFKPGDEIVLASTAYGAVTKAANYVADTSGAKLVIATLPVPLPSADAAVTAFTNVLSPRTRLVLVDHIVSPTGTVLPVRRIADAAHTVGARVLIDGAHAPGHIPLHMADTGADWYVGNVHKWLFVPRACGFLWAAPGTEAIHPLAISHGYQKGLIAEFDWTGTRDPAAVLSVPAAIAFHAKLGGAELMSRNAALLGDALDVISAALQTPLGAPREMFASMGTVALPSRLGTTEAQAGALRLKLSDEHRIEAVISTLAGGLWLRLAAQAYNERSEYECLAEVLRAL